jgi:hypothetical protein
MSDPPAPEQSTDPGTRRARRAWLLGIGGLLGVALLATGLAASWRLWKKAPPAEAELFPLPPLSPSPFLNTTAEAHYVGSDACRSCHPERHVSFRRTGMGRSMAPVDPAREPPDAAFDHPPSKRRYEVRRRDGRLWHRELLLGGGTKEVLLAEHPLKYVVGSGRHTLTYLVEADGFLVESPVTWYASRKAWGMSPGYDKPHQLGFERATGETCLHCHTGRAEAVGGSQHRMRVEEAAIGCERCHGPGSLHVRRQAGRKPPAAGAEADYTIVNPSRLSRHLAEAVCQQCHLQGGATAMGRGRKQSDFRPGLPLEDFRQDYWPEVPDASMTVTGHVEQMHLSPCYQRSDCLSCVTCHDPHDMPAAAERVGYYKAVCQQCHRPGSCTVGAERRLKESPEDDCVHCHMPPSLTEIPHVAFTHHRIGIHDGKAGAKAATAGAAGAPGVLRPFLHPTRLGEADQERSLGLAYLEMTFREKDQGLVARYLDEALRRLSAARGAGLRDPLLDVSLARVRFELRLGGVETYAESALAQPGLEGPDCCNALFLLADAHAAAGRHAEAVPVLRQLTGLRRHSVDWLLLADCQRALRNHDGCVQALVRAVRINPRLWKAHQFLAGHYRQQGDQERAQWHQERAVP